MASKQEPADKKTTRTAKTSAKSAAAQSKTAANGSTEEASSAGDPTAESAPARGSSARAGSEEGYVVLARRYRPATFAEVVGQRHVTQTLQNAIVAGRVHHAYLFTGSRGVGKTTVARILAKALNCDTGATANPCQTCTSCLEIMGGTSVDVYEIDGASHTGVDDVRELIESVRYLPARCRYKIFIIDEVHMLSTSAFNALLKTLEEPPPYVVFILATTEPHKIPATILSRCQRFDFKRVPPPPMIEHLESLCEREQVAIEPAGLALIARASEGSMRDGLSLLDQVIAYCAEEEAIGAERVAEVLGVADRRVLFQLSSALLARDAGAALTVVDRLFESGQDLSQFAQAFLGHLRDLTVVKTCKDPEPLVDATEPELAELIQQADCEAAALIPQFFDRFARTTEEISRSSFPRLLLEMAIIEMVHAEPLLPLGDLLQRLEQMEAQLGGTPRGPASAGPGSGTFRPPSGTSRSPQRASAPRGAGQQAAPQPAAPQPAAAPAPLSSPVNGQAMARWQELLNRVEQVLPVITPIYMSGNLLRWQDKEILLGYTPNSFELQRAQDKDKRGLFVNECSKQMGQTMTLTIREMQPGEENLPQVKEMSAMEDRARKQAVAEEKLKDEARTHPITRSLVENFGANIDSITTKTEKQ